MRRSLPPSRAHGRSEAHLLALLRAPATDAGLEVTGQFNLGESGHDFRVPDGGLDRPGAGGMWHPTAALVAEIVSAGEESWQKLSFYATHNVDEVVTVDASERIVTWMTMPGSRDPPAVLRRALDPGSRGGVA